MKKIKVWDPFVRIFHWSLVGCFAANALFVDDESKLHELIGYTMVALVVTRILWGFVGTRYARFSSFPPSRSGSKAQMIDMATGRKRAHLGHTPLGALMIYNIIATLLVIGLTGHMMTTDMFWGVEWPEEAHEAAVAWAQFSVVLHILAVIIESLRLRINLPRSMVSGYKDIPEGVGIMDEH